MSEQYRPVWLTREQRDDLTYIVNHLAMNDYPGMSATASLLVHKWDAAPADPVEAVMRPLRIPRLTAYEYRDRVLRGLGYPYE